MLKQVLHEIEFANGPVSFDDLSRKLNVEPSALKGMIQHWVRKGRLSDSASSGQEHDAHCGSSCNSGCSGAENCSFVLQMPRTYAIKLETDSKSG